MEQCLKCTELIDCDSQSIREKAQSLTREMQTEREKAVALYYFVRDGIKHNPYASTQTFEDLKASTTLEKGNGVCQHKATLLVALARASEIPARLGLVDVRDHMLSEKFRQMIGGGNLLPLHGYAELYLDGKWIHVSPAYDLKTCQKAGFVPVEFDGVNDAKDSAYNLEGKRHIEHVKYHGHFDDFPFGYIRKYTREWVERTGRDWKEFKDNVKKHQVREQTPNNQIWW